MYIRRPLCVFSLLFVIMLALISAVTKERGPDSPGDLDGRQLEFEGTVKKIEDKNGNHIFHIKNIYLSDGTDLDGNVLLYIPDHEGISEQVHIGSKIVARGDFSDFACAYNRGQFDLKKYHALRGDLYAVYKGEILAASAGYDWVSDSLYRVRERTRKVYERYFDSGDCGVIEALTLADKGRLDPEIKDRYSDAGIGHLLALSGLHIAGMGFILLKLFRRIRLPLWLCVFLSGLIMLAYCIMIGMPLSAVRALIMYLMALIALILRRTVDLRTSAALAGLVMLIVNPDSLWDASFLLSFSSVMGIGIVYPYVRELVHLAVGREKIRAMKRSPRLSVRLLALVGGSVLMSLSIQLAILPLTMWFYYTIPLYGILVNLIVIPLAGILLGLAVVVGIIGYISVFLPGCPVLLDRFTGFIARITHLILKLYDLMTRGVSMLPGAVIVAGRPALWQVIIYYLVLAGVLVYAAYLTGKLKGREARSKRARVKKKGPVCGLALCLLALAFLFIRIRPAYEISALYVGQGQCFVIHGRDVPTIMYDCGSSDQKQMGEYITEPFLECLGLDRVDTVFISHLDKDHVSGLLDLLSDEGSHIRIGRIVISADPAQTKSENYENLLTLAASRDIPVLSMAAGDSIKWKKMNIKCLWPDAEGEKTMDKSAEILSGSVDLNDGSLVLSLAYDKNANECKGDKVNRNSESSGKRESGGNIKSIKGRDLKNRGHLALFTGDISSEVEEELIDLIRTEGAAAGGFDYLQVAHHGSAGSANEAFIEAVSPRLGIVSAGIDNQYGHPHKETLEMFNKNRIPVFVTAESGEIDIRSVGWRVQLTKYR